MSSTRPAPARRAHSPVPRHWTEYRWTREKVHAFLTALADSGTVTAAARAVGMSRVSAYRLRARLGPEFAALWDRGLALSATIRRARAQRAEWARRETGGW